MCPAAKHLIALACVQGCSPAAKDTEGRTALHHAVMRGHLGCVDLLLGAGQPGLLLVRDILGCTPVHLAALQNQVALITRLVDALLRDGEGITPLHEVARRRCMQVCKPDIACAECRAFGGTGEEGMIVSV